MPYITSVYQEQIGSRPVSGGEATVRVQWTFGNLSPDFVEILQPGDSTTEAILHRVLIISGTRTPTSIDFTRGAQARSCRRSDEKDT
jgi:hypothetical protein